MYARYTLNLKSIMDNSEAYEQLQKAMSTYPLYVKKSKEEWIPSYIPTREELNNKIINYYKYHEIGFETLGRFLDELETAMNEIMPYYNLMFHSADQDFNIIYNVDYIKTMDATADSESTSTSNSATEGTTVSTGTDNSTVNTSMEDNAKNVNSQTPQSELSVTADNIDNVKYADNVTWNKQGSESTSNTQGETSTNATSNTSGNSTSEHSGNSSQKVLETTKGNYGQVSAQSLVIRYRESIANIEQMIINDHRIKELFMLIY